MYKASISEQIAIQTLLRDELGKIQLQNPSYSARSFAKKLGIAPSTVNEVLNGKRAISKKLALKMLEKLAVDPGTCSDVISKFDSKKLLGKKTHDKTFTQIDTDQFRTISEWYHFAILSLTETPDYNHDPEWIAARLGIKITDAKNAVERLERLGMLVKKDGQWNAGASQYHTPDQVNNISVRNAHAGNLELAKRSLEQDSIDLRDFSSMTMAIDPNKLPMARQMIRDFRNKLSAYLEEENQTEIFKICIQLFPLSNMKSRQGDI